jgi:phosphotriesterase-related protein
MRTLRSCVVVAFSVLILAQQAIAQGRYFLTVKGKVDANELRMALPHEHLVTNFIGADSVRAPQAVPAEELKSFLPSLEQARRRGVNFIFECTPQFIGRDVRLLKQLSERSGLHIVTNTGNYAASNRKYIPRFLYSETVEQLAKRWEQEFTHGIENTGIRPGFIKIGVDKGQLDSVESKLLRAAIMTSKKTGMPVAIHTGDSEAALSELEICRSESFKPEKMVWVHAQNGTDSARKVLADAGVYISLDGLNERNFGDYTEMITFLKGHNLLHKILISHDDGWSVLSNGSYRNVELFGNGNSQPYTTIFMKLIPALKKRGFKQSEVDQIMITNVIECFSFRE